MKKLFLLVAFTGIVGAASASSFSHLIKDGVTSVNQDGKKKEHHGKCCEKPKGDSTHHDCSKHEKGKCDMKKKDCKAKHDCSKHEKGKCDMHKDSTKTK